MSERQKMQGVDLRVEANEERTPSKRVPINCMHKSAIHSLLFAAVNSVERRESDVLLDSWTLTAHSTSLERAQKYVVLEELQEGRQGRLGQSPRQGATLVFLIASP